jgi:methionine sulfoxide reductase catalytic subunit
MLIKVPRPCDLPESAVSDESCYWNRRDILKGLGLGMGLGGLGLGIGPASAVAEMDPSTPLYPFENNDTFEGGRAITPEKITARYNNFYEFGSHKEIALAAQKLRIRPWTVLIDGLVEKEMTIGIDELLKKMPLEERIYRHRCVEAWSMVVPWSGFPLSELIDLAEPLSSAKYVVMETFHDPEVAPGQKQFWYPWPYREGLTIKEATNDLAFMVTGVYGKPLAKQFGSPLRLAVPWKYGYKSVKSIVRFNFVSRRPTSFWEEINAREYGFWANVNPDVPHPRWSQATERDLATGKRIPTHLFNGYGDEVADMYSGLKGEHLYR